MTEVELLPCPFCGGTDFEIFANCVECTRCGASGPRQDVGAEFLADTDVARDDWNRRAPTSSEPLLRYHTDPPRSGAAEGNEAGAAAPAQAPGELGAELEAKVDAIVRAIRPYTREALFLEEHRALVRAALAATPVHQEAGE